MWHCIAQGSHAEAIPVLERSSSKSRREGAAIDLFFLAMAHHQLGNHQKARGCYDEAVRWLTAKNALADTSSNGLAEFRAEAESTLAHFADDLPDQVFAAPR